MEQCLGISPDEDRAAGEDRDSDPAIPVDEIPGDFLIGDLSAVEIPLLDC